MLGIVAGAEEAGAGTRGKPEIEARVPDFADLGAGPAKAPTAGSLDLKLHVAARVLVRMGDSIRRSVAYVDVSAPARPAIGYKK